MPGIPQRHTCNFWTLITPLLVAWGSGALAPAADRPNIVVIYTDDQGYGDVGYLNPQAKIQTPHIDRLAREGIFFTDGHCSDTVCTPSRYGLLTGRYSWRTELKRGVFGAERACLISDDRVTLPSLLRDHGYRTAMVGKWHLGMDFPGTHGQRDWSQPVRDMPLDKGFDYFWGIPASMNYGVLAWFEGRFAQVPPTQYTRKKPNDLAISDYRIRPPYQVTPQRSNDLEVAPDFADHECLTRFTDRAIGWIESQAEAARDGTPFFLYLPYTSPHKPVIPVERFRGQSQAGAYGDFMMETDWHIGRVLEVLDRQQLTENTLVFFSSDNGPETTWKKRITLYGHHSSGPYREGKRSIYEGGHRVPMVIRWPARIRGGRSWDGPVCQTDLLATVADLLADSQPDAARAGGSRAAPLPADAAEDSISFLQVLLDGQARPRRLPLIHHAANGRFAIRDGDWKLVMETGKLGRELYNLAADPGEKQNLIDKSPEIATKLVGSITAIVQNGRTRPGDPVPNDTPAWSDLIWMK